MYGCLEMAGRFPTLELYDIDNRIHANYMRIPHVWIEEGVQEQQNMSVDEQMMLPL